MSVISRLQNDHPGTPIIILSAFGRVENTEPYTAGAEILPAHGVPNLRMCQAAVKASDGDFVRRLETIRDGLESLAGVSIDPATALDPWLGRAISQFASDNHLSHAEVTKAGGLSGATNAIVKLSGPGVPEMRVFAKVDRRDWLLSELDRRKRFVEGYLDAGNWAPTIGVLKAGLRRQAAYFLSLASNPTSFFQLVESDEPVAVSVIGKIETALTPWRMASTVPTTIGDLRRENLSDKTLEDRGLSLREFADVEDMRVTLSSNVTHGDLHGENILVVDSERPILVDFAYTGLAPGVLDPITLEMSFLFHPSSPLRKLGMPVDYVKWISGNYLSSPDMSDVTARCRTWATTNWPAEEFHAMSYAHAVRHLKQDGTPRNAVMAIARSAANALRESRN